MKRRCSETQVFVSMNDEGDVIVTPAEQHRQKVEEMKQTFEQQDGNLADLWDVEDQLCEPGVLDTAGRFKFPARLLKRR